MHETIVKNLKVCPAILAMLFYLRLYPTTSVISRVHNIYREDSVELPMGL